MAKKILSQKEIEKYFERDQMRRIMNISGFSDVFGIAPNRMNSVLVKKVGYKGFTDIERKNISKGIEYFKI